MDNTVENRNATVGNNVVFENRDATEGNNIVFKFIKCAIKSHISSNQKLNIFDEFIENCKYFYDKPAKSMKELKDRSNKKIRGDVFECFCQLYLLHYMKMEEAWLLSEVPSDTLKSLNLHRQDLGIDIISQDSKGNYYAVQCKYRKRNKSKSITVLGWKQLSTFYALATRTGPFKKHIVMTNANYIRHPGGKRVPTDRSVCLKSFQNTSLDKWNKMLGQNSYTCEETVQKPLSMEELREKRLQALSERN